MKKALLFILSISIISRISAQLPYGADAPDFDVQTLTGGTYSLYAMMGANKSACIDFSATWCGPCWAFHQSGVLENVHNNLSAYTTVIFLEADWNTNTACLYGPSGCVGGTQGNWVAGTPYPIADLSPTNGPTVRSDYDIAYFPTLYVISPDKRVWEIFDRSYQNYVNWITKSFTLNTTSTWSHSTCGDNGKITLFPTGGHSTLTYKWSNGATTKDLNNIPGGTYSVTITDVNNYFKTFGPWVIDGPSKRVDITNSTVNHVKCYGESTGGILIQVNYGTPPYTYQWSNGNTSDDNIDIKAGVYTVTVTDNVGCTRVKAYTISQPPDLTLTAITGKENCDNFDGFIQAKGNGGTPPYLYDIGFGDQQSPYFQDLKGGITYTVTITDGNFCQETVKAYVDVTNKPVVNAGTNKPLDCILEIINLDGTQSDQGGGFVNLWTTKNGNIVKGAESLLPDVDKPGRYYLKITNTGNKCFDTDSVDVIDARVFPNISTSNDTILNCVMTETFVQGNSNHLPTKYYWKKVNDTSFYAVGKNILVKDSGRYVFHVKDTLNLCVSKDTVLIDKDQVQPDAVAKVDKDVSCINTEIVIDGHSSSQGPQFKYTWTTGNGHIVSGETTLEPKIDKGGDYQLEVENTINFCKDNTSVNVIQQTQPDADFTKSINGLQVQLTDQTVGNPTSWNWTFGDGKNSNQKNPQHTFGADGEYEICLTTTNDCGQDVKCETVQVGKLDIELVCAINKTETACQAQADVNTKFATWLASTTYSGGCDATLSNNSTNAPPSCGGSRAVTFTVTSSCDPTKSCYAVFSVAPAQAVVLTCVANQTEAPCQTQAAINAKFATWLTTTSFSGGCNAVLSNNNAGAPSACGGARTVTFVTTSSCEAPKTCTSVFGVSPAQPIAMSCATNKTEPLGQTQAVINKKFTEWLATSTFDGGCNASISNNNTGAPNSTGGSAEVTWTVTSTCEGPHTCKAVFEVKDVNATSTPDFVKKFELTPNPVNNIGLLNIELQKTESYHLKLISVYGETVWTYRAASNESRIHVDFSSYAKGLYFAVLTVGNKQHAIKCVIN